MASPRLLMMMMHSYLMSTLKTLLLFALLASVAALVGFIVAGGLGVMLGAASVILIAAAASSASESMIMKLQGAVVVGPHQAPELFTRVAKLAERARIDMPVLYLSPSPAANAMAVGTGGRGALAVTQGAFRILGPAELEAVLAHEIAHLKNGDTKMLQLTAIVSRAALSLLRVGTWLAVLGVLLTGGGVARAATLALLAMIVPPIIGALRSALSRTRELAADADAAQLTGRPLALASALSKLETHHRGWGRELMASPQLPEWLRSHPPTRERVDRLVDMTALSTSREARTRR